MLMLIPFMILTNTIFLTLTHPLSMGLTLIIQTLTIAIFSSLILPSFWFSYILILVFLGGMLILFIYMSTLASNEQFNLPLSVIPALLFSGFLSLSLFFSPPQKMFLFSDNMPSDKIFTWIFSPSFFLLASLLIIYLFLVLIAIIKITKFWAGTLRPIN